MSAALRDPPPALHAGTQTAQRWLIGGRVQGVGFRPFVYRLAHLRNLKGWVRNRGGEVEVHAEGPAAQLQLFSEELLSRAPPAAAAILLQVQAVQSERSEEFRILSSTPGEKLQVHVPADLFTCDECLAELTDPGARRYRYPFINCTQCGPRYTLIRRMPYDRPNTTLDQFPLCSECAAEYAQPLDRRFHAQPLACPGLWTGSLLVRSGQQDRGQRACPGGGCGGTAERGHRRDARHRRVPSALRCCE